MLPSPDALLGTLVRLAAFAGLLLAIGAVASRELVLTRVSAPTWPGALRRLTSRVATVGMVGAALALVAHVGRLWLQLLEVRLPDLPVSTDLLQTLVWRTTWGKLWLAQGAATLVAWRAFAVARRDLRAAWLLATVGSVALALLTAFASHASGTGALAPLTVAADTVHLLAGGAWVGGLAALFAAALWPRSAPTREALSGSAAADDAAIAALVPTLMRAFSPMALGAAALLVLTGTLASWVHLRRPADLWLTSWGVALLAKLAFVVLALVLGAVNWRRMVPALGTPRSDARLRMTVWFELTAMAVVLLATAVLVALPLPDAS